MRELLGVLHQIAERGPNELTRDAVAGLAKRAITLVNQPRPEALPSVGLDSLAASLADMRGRWVELIRHNGWGDQFDGDIQNVDDAIAFIESVPKGPCGDCPAQQSCAVNGRCGPASSPPVPDDGDGCRFHCTSCGHTYPCVDETVCPPGECPVCGEETVEDRGSGQ